jgi:SAM-dependent methyltransferase
MDAADREHFDRIAERYERTARSWQTIYDRVAACLNPLIDGRRVLDVGSGGEFPYDTSRAAEVIALDISPNMLEGITVPNVVPRVGDARSMPGIEDASVDVVLFLLSLHHINGESAPESLATLDGVLASARRALRPGGDLVVVEPVLPGWLLPLESLCFPLTRAVLGAFGVPMIYFYSLAVLRGRLARHFALSQSAINVERIVVEGRIDPLGGSFPGWIRIPHWMHPFEHCLLSLRANGV